MIRNWNNGDIHIAGENANFAKNVAKWIEAGLTSKGLCFLLDDCETIRGGIVLSKYESGNVDVLDFSLSTDSFNLGTELLKHSISKISARNICYNLYDDSSSTSNTSTVFLKPDFV